MTTSLQTITHTIMPGRLDATLLEHAAAAVSGDIPAISDGARRLATGLAAAFYREDFDHHFAMLEAYADPELLGDEWVPA